MTDPLSPERIDALRSLLDQGGRQKYQEHVATIDALLSERSRNEEIVAAAKRWKEWRLIFTTNDPYERALYDAVAKAESETQKAPPSP